MKERYRKRALEMRNEAYRLAQQLRQDKEWTQLEAAISVLQATVFTTAAICEELLRRVETVEKMCVESLSGVELSPEEARRVEDFIEARMNRAAGVEGADDELKGEE